MLFNRDLEADLALWLARKKRKPIILRGARQVGKSTLVRKFAADHQHDLFEINLEKHPELNDVFASFDMLRIIREIEGICEKKSFSYQVPAVP